jgi:hypothetical protein
MSEVKRRRSATMEDVNRRKFLLASGAAATGAAVVVTPKLVDSIGAEKSEAIATPVNPAPSDPVMAYVHDASRGELTVMSGTAETTYRDPALVKRLLDAAPAPLEGGETGVITP